MTGENVENGFRQTGARDNTFFLKDVDVTATGTELNVLDGITATTAELNTKTLNIKMSDISTAGSIYVVSPFAGTYSKLYSVIDGTIATADAVITAEINGSAVTNGGLTIAYSGSAAGDVDSGTPTAANTVAVGDVIEIITSGASTNTVSAEFTIVITL
jgi:hypothetical protein